MVTLGHEMHFKTLSGEGGRRQSTLCDHDHLDVVEGRLKAAACLRSKNEATSILVRPTLCSPNDSLILT